MDDVNLWSSDKYKLALIRGGSMTLLFCGGRRHFELTSKNKSGGTCPVPPPPPPPPSYLPSLINGLPGPGCIKVIINGKFDFNGNYRRIFDAYWFFLLPWYLPLKAKLELMVSSMQRGQGLSIVIENKCIHT